MSASDCQAERSVVTGSIKVRCHYGLYMVEFRDTSFLKKKKLDFNMEGGCFFHLEPFGGFSFLSITHFPNKTKFQALSVNILVLSIISASISVIQFTIHKLRKQTITTTVLQWHWGSRNFHAYLSRPKQNLSSFFTICL